MGQLGGEVQYLAVQVSELAPMRQPVYAGGALRVVLDAGLALAAASPFRLYVLHLINQGLLVVVPGFLGS